MLCRHLEFWRFYPLVSIRTQGRAGGELEQDMAGLTLPGEDGEIEEVYLGFPIWKKAMTLQWREIPRECVQVVTRGSVIGMIMIDLGEQVIQIFQDSFIQVPRPHVHVERVKDLKTGRECDILTNVTVHQKRTIEFGGVQGWLVELAEARHYDPVRYEPVVDPDTGVKYQVATPGSFYMQIHALVYGRTQTCPCDEPCDWGKSK